MIEKINHMLSDIQLYKGRDKQTIMYEAIKLRLQQSFDSYEHDMDQSLAYLTRRNELNVARKLNSKRKPR